MHRQYFELLLTVLAEINFSDLKFVCKKIVTNKQANSLRSFKDSFLEEYLNKLIFK
jgi:hypothetical protein